MFFCSNIIVPESRKEGLTLREEEEASWGEESMWGCWDLWGNLSPPGPLCHLG